jgi:hypothetical protein
MHEQRLIDRFWHDTHADIVGELDRQTATDLLRRPVLLEAVLHEQPQCGLLIELGRLWSLRSLTRRPVRPSGPIMQAATVALHLA